LTKKNEAKGKIKITIIEIEIQIFLHSIILNKNTINNGSVNSAKDKPSHVVLNAFPLLLSKYLEIVVVAVWDIKPCPDNLIKKIEKKRKITEEILEKIKLDDASKIITKKENFRIFTSSIFFPIQTKIKLLNNVADA